jgi:hypothetical protein
MGARQSAQLIVNDLRKGNEFFRYLICGPIRHSFEKLRLEELRKENDRRSLPYGISYKSSQMLEELVDSTDGSDSPRNRSEALSFSPLRIIHSLLHPLQKARPVIQQLSLHRPHKGTPRREWQ